MKVAVIGGGLSGLTAARRLRQAGADVVVLEGREQIGGVLRRGTLTGLDLPLDLGAEAMLVRRPEARDLAVDVGLGDDLEVPAVTRASVYSRGALHPLPSGQVMGVPGDADALAGLLTPAETERLRAGLAAPGAATEADVSVGDWLSSRLGPAVVDRVVEPLLGGVYAGRVSRLSLQATVPALWPVARTGEPIGPAVRRISAAAAGGPVFTGLRGGVARLVERLAELLVDDGVELRRGALATRLRRRSTGWTVEVGTHEAGPTRLGLDVDAVLLAVPAPAAAKLLASVPETSSAAAILGQIEVASMALITLALPGGTLPSTEDDPRSGVLVPAVERRLVKAMTFTSTKWGWAAGHGADLLRLSVGRAGETAHLHRPDEHLVAAAVRDAEEILGRELPVAAQRVTRWGGGLPQYDVGHLDAMARARAELAGVPGLQACGAVWDGVGIPACVATATAAAARLLDDWDGLVE